MEIDGYCYRVIDGVPQTSQDEGLLKRLTIDGVCECVREGFVKSRLDKVSVCAIGSNDEYFNLLVSISEYSFLAFQAYSLDPEGMVVSKNDGVFNNRFHYDYSNAVDYTLIYTCLKNPLICDPVYDHYCNAHKDGVEGTCLDCLERYRVITRNLIPLMRTMRKDLCSIYFMDVLYDLIRFESRHVYAFVVYVLNNFGDGSSFKSFAASFGKRKIRMLLKRMNRPFRRMDFKMILKKYVPVLYAVYTYCANARIDCLDRVYDYMLHEGLSMFKTVPSEHVVVGYVAGDQYQIDILQTSSVLDFAGDQEFVIGSNLILESLNFGFYKLRQSVFHGVNGLDNQIKQGVRKMYSGFRFSGQSVFTGRTIHSQDAIIIGFLKKSLNTFQNFRLDIHIESIIPNSPHVDRLRLIDHDKWAFEDNEYDKCYIVD